MNILSEQNIEAIKQYVAQHPEIVAIYLYGSHSQGVANGLSDVDLAVLIREPLSRPEIDMRLELVTDLSRLLEIPIDTIDVQVLTSQTSLLFASQVFEYSTLLATNDLNYTLSFQQKITFLNIDFSYYRALATGAMMERLRTDTYASR